MRGAIVRGAQLLIREGAVQSKWLASTSLFACFSQHSRTFVRIYLRILDFRQLWTPPRGKFSDLSARLLPEIFDRIAFERELKGNFAS
tara:strand:- start:253 stop:516 length:264 start_codon:yes stop_codon:yes gene_type:complete